ncbi:MAG: two-component regulator propeller domain-containing protein, partial [Acidobacteriota bacterium]
FQPAALSETRVEALLEDREGFLWIDTTGLPGRFDGHRFRTFAPDPDDPTKLPSAELTDMMRRRNGEIWIATQSAVSVWLEDRQAFRTFKYDPNDPRGLPSRSINQMMEDSRGRLWIGTDAGLARLDGGLDDGFERPVEGEKGLEEWAFEGLQESSNGDVYAGSDTGVLVHFDGVTGELTRFPQLDSDDGSVTLETLAEDEAGHLWIGSALGLGQIDGDGWRLVIDETTGRPLFGEPVMRLEPASEGRLWLVPQAGGLFLLDPETATLDEFVAHAEDGEVPFQTEVSDVYRDRGGAVWISDRSGLLGRFYTDTEPYPVYDVSPSETTWRNTHKLCGDLQTVAWAATSRGIVEIDADGSRWLGLSPALEDGAEVLTCLASSRGDLWIGGREGLAIRRRGRDRFESLPSFTDSVAVSYLIEAGGQIYVGSSSSVFRVDLDGQNRVDFEWWLDGEPHPTAEIPRQMLVGEDGRLVVMPLRGGLFRQQPGTDALVFERLAPDAVDLESSPRVYDFYEEPDGDLWLATATAGLKKLGLDGEVTDVGVKEGLRSQHTLFVLGDGKGRLWVMNAEGWSRYDPTSGDVTHFPVGPPRQGLSIIGVKRSLDESGPAWLVPFGRYLIRFDPDRLDRILATWRVPQPVLSGLLAYNRPVEVGGSILDGAPHRVEEIRLDHTDDVITFELASPDYRELHMRRYRYRLRGFHDDWIETDPAWPVANYTDLDGGRFDLEVQVSADGGLTWGPGRDLLAVQVAPPPWRSPAAYLLYTLLGGALVFGFVHSQRRKLRQEQRVNEQLRQIDRLKDDFLANTSHELRTPLFGISGLTESMIERAGDQPASSLLRELHTVLSSSRRLSSLVDDILDFSKVRRGGLELLRAPVDLHSIVDVVLTLSRPLAADKDLRLLNAVAPELPAAHADAARLEQILHNLIGNAIKFTPEGRIDVGADARVPHGDLEAVADALGA